ncbi:hypothetical protein DFS34DRAFT_648308 [Phlyctochytrium arcticum]|nr:hypothetical protein DFS34DRAFT_648308 [Phlyctochytrium arcticum]
MGKGKSAFAAAQIEADHYAQTNEISTSPLHLAPQYLYYIFVLNFDVVGAKEACHPDSHAVEEIWKLDYSETTFLTRGNCYFDTVFYQNAALLARPKTEYAWLEPWVRQYWAHVLRMFGSCSVKRVIDPLYGRQCENHGAPKPLFVFASRIGADDSESDTGYPRFWDPFRNYLKIEARTFSNAALIKEMLAHAMLDVHQLGPQGTGSWHFHRVWSWYGGFAHFPLYDFYYQTGETAAAPAYYNRWIGWPSGGGLAPNVDWFGFFYTLWMQSGKNLHFMTKSFDYWSCTTQCNWPIGKPLRAGPLKDGNPLKTWTLGN